MRTIGTGRQIEEYLEKFDRLSGKKIRSFNPTVNAEFTNKIDINDSNSALQRNCQAKRTGI